MAEPDATEARIRDFSRRWLSEVADLRALVVPGGNGELRRFDVPGAGAQPPEIREALVAARGCLDRVEEIYGQAMALADAARARAREMAEKADDALDDAISARSRRARDFEAARERLADAQLDAINERRAARRAQKLADLATSTERRIRLSYYGLTGLRDDLSKRLAAFAWEANLDR